MKLSKVVLPIVLFTFLLASCSPNTVQTTETEIPTIIQTTAAPSTSTLTATASQTPQPSVTNIPPTITVTPTPDYTQIKLYGAHLIQGNYGSLTQVSLEMGNLQGEFYGIAGNDNYKCKFRKDIPTQMDCVGAPVPENKRINFSLFISTQTEPIFKTTYIFSGVMPTPQGMVCEIEGLWTDIIKSRGYISEPGCYAVTCWINGTYYGGVQDSCKEYWPWIPQGLFPTPLPTP